MNRNTANLWLGVIRVLMIAAIPSPAFSQAVESLTAGTKVRVKTIAPSGWRVGYVRSIDGSEITATTLSPAQSKSAPEATYVWTVPLASVTQAEVSRGVNNRAGRTVLGAVLGGVGGGVIIGALGYMATRCSNCEESGIGVIAGPVLGVPIGILFGALAGFVSTRERWEPVSVAGKRIPAGR